MNVRLTALSSYGAGASATVVRVRFLTAAKTALYGLRLPGLAGASAMADATRSV